MAPRGNLLLGWWSDCQWCGLGLRRLSPKHRRLLLLVKGDTAKNESKNQDQREGDGQDHLPIRPGLRHDGALGFHHPGRGNSVCAGQTQLSSQLLQAFSINAAEQVWLNHLTQWLVIEECCLRRFNPFQDPWRDLI